MANNTFRECSGENATCEYCTRVITRKDFCGFTLWSCRVGLFDRTCPFDIKRGRFLPMPPKPALVELHESFRREPIAT